MANIVVSALATWNGKALKKGQKELNSFEKSIKSFTKSFGIAFGAVALGAFTKKAINAFAADEKAAKSLAVQLQNTGNAFRIGEVEAYIAKLQNLYGVLDDQLRPAFQNLLNATGSVTLSQKALETALNVSAGTGQSLETVISAIAAGVRGQTKAIKGLNTGIDANIIASGDMNKIMAALEKRFAGQALARLSTYAGKMDLLKVAAADATEIIGKGLIDALTALAKDNSIDEATKSMNNFALAIADTVAGLGQLVGEVKKFTDSDVGKLVAALAFLVFGSKKLIIGGALALIGFDIGKNNPSAQANMGGYSGIPDLRVAKLLLKARTDEYKIIAAKNAIDTKSLDELKKKFDVERIGLTAALNNATDGETKLRLQAQLAILDGNEAMAKKILAEMEAAEALRKLAEQAKAAGMSLQEFAITQVKALINRINAQIAAINDLFGMPSKSTLGTSNPGSSPLTVDYYSGQQNIVNPLAGTYAGETGRDPMPVTITVDTSTTGDQFAQLIAQSLQVATKSGISYGIAGGL